MQQAIANINRSQEKAVISTLKTVYFMAKKNLANDIFGDIKQFLILQVSKPLYIATYFKVTFMTRTNLSYLHVTVDLTFRMLPA